MAALMAGSPSPPKKSLTDDEMAGLLKQTEPSRDLEAIRQRIPIGVRAPERPQFPMPGYENVPPEKPLVREDPIGDAIAMTSGAKAGMKLAKPILDLATKSAVRGAATGLAGSLLGYEASAVPMAMGQAAAVGENPLKAGKDAATDPMALATTGTLGALGGAGRGAAAGIRDPRNLSGRVLRDVEAAGGQIKKFGEPVAGGLYESPELQGVKSGRAGVNELAGNSVERVIKAQQERLARARDAFGEASDQIIAEHGDRHIPVTSAHAALDEIEHGNTINGVTGDERIATNARKLRQMLTTDTGQLDARASAAAGAPITVKAPAVKADDLIAIRKFVNRQARQATEPADRYVYGKILGALSDDAGAADPRIGQMNQAYKAEMQQLSAGNDALFGQKRPELRDTEAARAGAVGKLGRVGDDTQAGTIGEGRLDRAAAASPDIAREVRLMAAKKAQERLRYGGGGETSTSIEKGMGNAVKRGAAPLIGAALGGHLGYAAGEAAARFGNPLALKLRLGLPAAETAARIGGRPAAGAGQLIDLARKRRDEQAQAAQMLMGGGN